MINQPLVKAQALKVNPPANPNPLQLAAITDAEHKKAFARYDAIRQMTWKFGAEVDGKKPVESPTVL